MSVIGIFLGIMLLFFFICLKNTIIEARSIGRNLESIMENAANISRSIVDDIDKRISSKEEIYEVTEQDHPGEMLSVESLSPEVDIQEMIESDNEEEITYRPKVYELARELGLSSKSLLSILQEMGYNISHHMNILDIHIVKQVKGRVNKGDLITAEDDIQQKQRASVIKEVKADSAEMRPGSGDMYSAKYNRVACEKPGNESWELEIDIDDLKLAHPYLAVRTLHEKGYSVREIAKLLERGQGEVNLILNLTKKKQAL